MLLFDIITLLGFVFCVSISFYLWRKREILFSDLPVFKEGKWNLPLNINEKSLGLLEGCNPQLREVLVVAHQVEEPQNGLLRAVRKNFQSNVKYRFLISKSKYEKEKDRYIKVFQGYANIDSAEDVTHNDLIFVHKLKHEWEDVPYLFYRCIQEGDQNKEFIFAYRGSQIFEGIADKYFLMEPAQAHTIFRLVESISEEQIPTIAELVSFTPNDSNVVDASELFKKKIQY